MRVTDYGRKKRGTAGRSGASNSPASLPPSLVAAVAACEGLARNLRQGREGWHRAWARGSGAMRPRRTPGIPTRAQTEGCGEKGPASHRRMEKEAGIKPNTAIIPQSRARPFFFLLFFLHPLFTTHHACPRDTLSSERTQMMAGPGNTTKE